MEEKGGNENLNNKKEKKEKKNGEKKEWKIEEK